MKGVSGGDISGMTGARFTYRHNFWFFSAVPISSLAQFQSESLKHSSSFFQKKKNITITTLAQNWCAIFFSREIYTFHEFNDGVGNVCVDHLQPLRKGNNPSKKPKTGENPKAGGKVMKSEKSLILDFETGLFSSLFFITISDEK